MRAAVYERYGPPDVVEVKDVDTPVPGDHDVLVRVHATTVCAADWRLRKGDPVFTRFISGLSRPHKVQILGMEFAGTIKTIGKRVTRFAQGDAVFGSTGFKFGAHAEYVRLPETGLVASKPANMSFDEAAAVLFGAVSALHFLREAGVHAGQQVLVYGASGSVGVFAVQLARYFGAHVTAVCSTANVELVQSLGAHHVIDYTREDFSAAGPLYDIVVDTVGKAGFSRCVKSLKPRGTLATIGYSGRISSVVGDLIRGMWWSSTRGGRTIGGVAKARPGDLDFFRDLIERGALRTVIDRRYSLDEIAEAHRHAEGGHKRGHVVVRPSPGDPR